MEEIREEGREGGRNNGRIEEREEGEIRKEGKGRNDLKYINTIYT